MVIEVSPDDPRGRPLDFLEAHDDHLYIMMDRRKEVSKYICRPDSQQVTETGTVISKGSKVSDDFQEGDKVMIRYNIGVHIQIEENYTTSEFHRIVREHEIMTKINQEKRDAFNKE